jgi:hypothetical protein
MTPVRRNCIRTKLHGGAVCLNDLMRSEMQSKLRRSLASASVFSPFPGPRCYALRVRTVGETSLALARLRRSLLCISDRMRSFRHTAPPCSFVRMQFRRTGVIALSLKEIAYSLGSTVLFCVGRAVSLESMWSCGRLRCALTSRAQC